MKPSDAVQRALLRRLFALPPSVLRRIAGAPVTSPEGYVLGAMEQLLIDAAARLGRKEAHVVGVARARLELDRGPQIVDFDPSPLRSVRGLAIDGPRGSIPIRVYDPEGAGPKPVHVYFHGGGFVVGSILSHDGVCGALASMSSAIVVSVGYRLAPEEPFPAAIDDAVAATRWAIREASSFGGDPRAVSIGGDSAGGNLAAVVAHATRGDDVRPVFQLLVYPATDFTRALPSHRHFREGFLLTEAGLDWYTLQYIGDDAALKLDPRCSPLFAKDFSGLPPAMVLTAGFDPLRDEGLAYAEKLRAAGVRVDYTCLEESVHGFFSFGGVMPHARRAVEAAAAAIRGTARRT